MFVKSRDDETRDEIRRPRITTMLLAEARFCKLECFERGRDNEHVFEKSKRYEREINKFSEMLGNVMFIKKERTDAI